MLYFILVQATSYRQRYTADTGRRGVATHDVSNARTCRGVVNSKLPITSTQRRVIDVEAIIYAWFFDVCNYGRVRTLLGS